MNEFQNAFKNQLNLAIEEGRVGTDPKVGEALEKGQFVVVCVQQVSCPITDGLLGSKVTLSGVFEDYGEAETQQDCLMERFGGDGIGFLVYCPKGKEKVAPPPPCDPDDIPF